MNDRLLLLGRLARVIVPIIVVLLVFSGSYFTVAPNQQALVLRLGRIDRESGPGLGLKLPFIETAEIMRTDVVDVAPDKPVNTYTIDNQEVDVSFAVFYRIPVDKVAFVYANVRDYQARLLTMAVDRLKVEVGKVNVSSVAERRGELRDAVKSTLQRDAKSLGIEVTDFLIPNLTYDERYRAAVSAAAVQKAGVEQMEYQRQQAEKTAQTAQIKATGEANAARETARGTADANVLTATAEAQAIRLKGEAQAEAIRAQAGALAASTNLVELRKAERWDGKLPTQMYAGAPIPFLHIESAK